MSWERAIWGEDAVMPDMPETIQLDKEVLAPIQHARTAAQRLMAGSEEALTVADMKLILGAQEESLLSMDRVFQLELTYLMNYAQPVMDPVIRTLVLDALPQRTASSRPVRRSWPPEVTCSRSSARSTSAWPPCGRVALSPTSRFCACRLGSGWSGLVANTS